MYIKAVLLLAAIKAVLLLAAIQAVLLLAAIKAVLLLAALKAVLLLAAIKAVLLLAAIKAVLLLVTMPNYVQLHVGEVNAVGQHCPWTQEAGLLVHLHTFIVKSMYPVSPTLARRATNRTSNCEHKTITS